MILSEKLNPYNKYNQDIFFGKLGTFLILKKGQERLLPTSCQSVLTDDNIKKFNARLLFVSTAKMDNNYSFSKFTSSVFFFYASNCLLRVFIYLTPFDLIFPLLPLLYCSNLLSMSSSKVLVLVIKKLRIFCSK